MDKPLYDTKNLTLIWDENAERNEDIATEILPTEVGKYSQAAHKRDTEGYDLSQNALCFTVLGGITLIVGILFIFLSLKKRKNAIVGVNFASLQFIICVICLAAGLTLLTIGGVLLAKALRKRKNAKRDITYLGTLSREQIKAIRLKLASNHRGFFNRKILVKKGIQCKKAQLNKAKQDIY